MNIGTMFSSTKIDPEIVARRQRYREHSSIALGLPLFSKGWWLDAVVGDNNWDAVIVEKDGKIVASLPFVTKRKLGLIRLTHPPLTQTLGPWLSQSSAKYAKQLGREKDLMQELFDQLPPHHQYLQNWHHERMNWLPLYWRGFQQTTQYTYRLTNIADEKLLWAELSKNIRTDIRKAQNRFSLVVREDLSVQDFLELNKQVFVRQGMKLPYSEEMVHNIDKACVERNARKILIAEDSEGRRHAGVYIVWDENSAYYLMGGGDPLLRNSGATSLCMWEAIRFSASVTNNFDFEGSMLEQVERYFRGFGAVQTPYFKISSTPSNFLKTILFLKSLLRGA